MKAVKLISTGVVLLVAWVIIWWLITLALDVDLLNLWNALIAAAVVTFGYWLVSTGRLARMFRKV